MQRDELGSLLAFVTVAQDRSFTRAAGKLGTSQSSLSHTIRRLERRLNVRLLHRTTRSVSPTEAGSRLLARIGPSLMTIQSGLEELTTSRDRIAGTVRVSSADHAAETLLWPVIRSLLPEHPDVRFEIHVENGFVDIVSVPRDMVAMPIGGEERAVVVCAPAYLVGRDTPATIDDLESHDCINRTLPTLGGVAPWRFSRGGKPIKVRVAGTLTFNRPELMIDAALAGFGIANLLESQVRDHLDAGRLIRLLPDWSAPLPGYRIYYPKSRQPTPAFRLMLQALRSLRGRSEGLSHV